MKKFIGILLCAAMLLTPAAVSAFAVEGKQNPPKVIPAIREWEGKSGQYKLPKNPVLVIPEGKNDNLDKKVDIIREYFKDYLGVDITVKKGSAAKAGEILLAFDKADEKKLGGEGYTMKVSDKIEIRAPKEQGLFYGVITVLQSLKADGFVPCGNAVDYPSYPLRGGMIDVARAYLPLEYVEEIAKYFAFFKLNEIHLHINDIGENNYNIFRLESNIEGLTAKDGFYSKKDYRNFQLEMKNYGLDVITEIDTPAHSSCFNAVRPDLMLPDGRHLDITKPETLEFVKGLFDEYLGGDEPVIVSDIVHIGTDEYDTAYSEEMRKYTDALLKHVKSYGKTPRFWGAFGNKGFNGKTPVMTDAQTNFWAVELSDWKTLFDMGYDVINTCGPVLYIVPGGNYGFADYYNLKNLYTAWQVNYMGWNSSDAVAPDNPQLKGASFALWNDLHTRYGGFSMFDIFDRIRGGVCLMSEKCWCGVQTEKMSADDFINRFETLSYRSGNSNPGRHHNLPLKDDEARALKSVGFPYTVSFDVKVDSVQKRQELFTGKDGKVFIDNNGRIILSREVYNFRFDDYNLPEGKWVNLKFFGDNEKTVLCVDNTYYYFPTNLKNPKLNTSSTFVFPLEEFAQGAEYKNLVVSDEKLDLNSMLLNSNIALNKKGKASALEVNDGRLAEENAFDGNPDTRLSFSRDDDHQWLVVDLEKEYKINKINIDFFEHISDYKVSVSTDGENYTEVAHIQKEGDGKRIKDEITFEPTKARYIKYEQLARHMTQWGKYSGGICEFEVYAVPEVDFDGLLEKVKDVDDREVRSLRFALKNYLKGDMVIASHAEGLAKQLNAAYENYLNPVEESKPEESEASEESKADTQSKTEETKTSKTGWIILGAAAVIAGIAVGIFIGNKRKKKETQGSDKRESDKK